VQVRVSAVVYSSGSFLDIKLGEYSDRSTLQAEVIKLKYYRGSTYTNRALDMTKNLAMPESVTRPGVAK
jgi:hypothetical protein